jgi:hypothetical protein
MSEQDIEQLFLVLYVFWANELSQLESDVDLSQISAFWPFVWPNSFGFPVRERFVRTTYSTCQKQAPSSKYARCGVMT